MNTQNSKHNIDSANLEHTDTRNAQERFRHFTTILAFQIVSAFGSSLTSFALGVWAYQTFNSYTAYGLILFAAYMSEYLMSPIAGNFVDRWNKKLVLLYSSLGSASITLIIATLLWFEALSLWQIFILTFANGILTAFSKPAIITVIKMLIDPKDLDRANGVMAMGFGLISLLGPIVAGALMLNFGIETILLIDLSTFVIGIVALSFLRLPFMVIPLAEPLIDGIRFAWNYLLKKSNLLWLIGLYTVMNFFIGIAMVLLQPMVLSLTDTQGLGMVMTIGGIGYVFGATIMGTWGGPKKKIHSIYGVGIFVSLCMIFTPMSTNIWILSLGAFALSAAMPIFITSNMVIIQLKVETSVLGRVNGLGTIITGVAIPMGYLVGGPLAEHFFEPIMMEASSSLEFLQDIYGIGKGRGVALLISLSSLILGFIVLAALFVPKIRNIETDLPNEN